MILYYFNCNEECAWLKNKFTDKERIITLFFLCTLEIKWNKFYYSIITNSFAGAKFGPFSIDQMGSSGKIRLGFKLSYQLH
jgi:hypothetical protein